MPIENKLLAERGQCIEAMRGLLNRAEAEGRDLSAEEQAEYGRYEARQTEIGNLAKRAERLGQIDAEVGQAVNAVSKLAVKADKGDVSFRNSAEYKEALDVMLRRGGPAVIDPRVHNALQVGTDSEGGYVVPQEFEKQLLMALQDINEVRNWVNVISTASDRHIPVESTLGAAAWTAEEAAFNESDAAFSRITLNDYKATTIIKVSDELLRDSMFDLQSYLAGNFGKRFGILEEAAFVNGDGSSKPTGIVPGSSLGKTAAGAAAITADELIDLYHALSRPYRKNAVWMMADATAKMIRKLKDTTNQYLWQPGLQAGQPDTLFGRPVIVSDSMPAATTGLKSVVFGDLSYYTVADRQGVTVQRLNELYAATGQVGFRAYKRTDGKVTLSSAIKHLIQA
jgi:HK97 family phage major capsid protein